MTCVAKNEMGLDELPFPYTALEHPPGNKVCPEIYSFMLKCSKLMNKDNSDKEAIKLIALLQNNHPKESYENPSLPTRKCSKDEVFLMHHIFYNGIDLPGSRHNPYGKPGYFTNFFFDMYFGNFTEFMDHINSLSRDEQIQALKKREGYCRFSPIFAPILGLKMASLDKDVCFTSQEKREIRSLYHGQNENKHREILQKLVDLGADPNVHDINGYTPLNYCLRYVSIDAIRMTCCLLRHGANPNFVNRQGQMALTILHAMSLHHERQRDIVDVLLQFDAKLDDRDHESVLRANAEKEGFKDFIIRVRLAFPRGNNECEKCVKPAAKKCAACGKVFYCSPVCQKLDWKFHKLTCGKSIQWRFTNYNYTE